MTFVDRPIAAMLLLAAALLMLTPAAKEMWRRYRPGAGVAAGS